jgi:hypothetical protein
MAETIRDVTMKLRVVADDVPVKIPNVDSAGKALIDYNKALDALVKQNATMQSQIVSMAEELNKLKTVTTEVVEATNKQIDVQDTLIQLEKETVKLGESYHKVADGAIKVVEGMALLGIASDKNAKQLVQDIAAVKGFAGTIRGALDVVKGLTEAKEAIAKITKLNTLLTTADTTATVANTSAKSAAMLVMGPVGWTLAAIAAAVTLATMAWNRYTASVEEAKQKEKDAADERRRLTEESAQAIGRNAGFAAQLIALEDSAKAMAMLSQKTREYQQLLSTRPDEQSQLAILAAMKQTSEAYHKSQLDIISAKEKSLELAQKELDTAQQALAAEKSRVASIDASLGRLNKVEQHELSRLLGNAQRGTLDVTQAERLGQLGGSAGGVIRDRFLAERGSQFEDRSLLLSMAGMPDRTSVLQQAVQNAESATGTQQDIAQQLSALKTAREQSQQELVKILRNLITQEHTLSEKVRQMASERQQQQAAGVM